MTDLHQIVINLAKARIDRDEIADRIAAARAEFEASIENLKSSKFNADARVAELEDVARTEAIAAYNTNPDGGKKPHPALGIREGMNLVYQEDDAIGWAIAHDIRAALKLNKSAFEKLAKAGGVAEIPIRLEPVITATIATDLSEYFDEGA